MKPAKLAVWVFLLALSACGASQREKDIHTTLTALDVGAAAFVSYDGKHQMDIVGHAANREDGEAKLKEYRAKREKVTGAFMAAFRAVAVAATVNDDPSFSGMLEAAVIVQQELSALGVKL